MSQSNKKSVRIPYLSDEEHKKLTSTLSDLSRNSMIRFEVMQKRSKGMTVDQACREVGDQVDLDPDYVRKLYYTR